MTSPADAITNAVRSVTKAWRKQRIAEERDRNAVFHRQTRLMRSHRIGIREVAFDVMEEAYSIASGPERLPVKPRQIMYVARPTILRRTGVLTFNDTYFTQHLLIDYMEEYDCDDWDIIWDARGHFFEPHTRIEVPLGTLEVRQYLGERPSFDRPTHAVIKLFPTAGPQNRYENVVFIEKEGFHPILAAAALQARFDIALMSTKGMSVTASRVLLDRLAALGVENIFSLHDFDVSGFSIFGTLGTNSRRYRFNNSVRVIDIGLRLADAQALSLQSEPVPREDPRKWTKRMRTLQRHGATPEEIEFLRTQRVELNAMTSPQLIAFIESKLAEHGVTKLIPDSKIIEQQARRVIKDRLTREALDRVAGRIAKETEATALPKNLKGLVTRLLKKHPELPWDAAVAEILFPPAKEDDG